MEIYIASQNAHKIKEIQSLLEGQIMLKSIFELGQISDLEESGSNLIENALQKARYISTNFNVNCFADDSGLEVEILNNEPGVFSARYAGNQKNADDNINLLLKNLENKANRNACFKTVIASIVDGKEIIFEGIIKGYYNERKKR